MSADLIERTHELDVLQSACAQAERGAGSVALVCGEAGIGKTSLIRAFLRSVETPTRVLYGACDDLATPRVLGPFRDAAPVDGPLADALASGNRDDILTAALFELSDRERPTVLVVEDVHWADDATLDVLRYLSRRIIDHPAVLVVSYRDDTVSRSHPAQRFLGSLGGAHVNRIALPRLSRAAVARLAGGTAATSAPLYRLTEGNPFFVSELLAAPDDVIPATIADAVLARVNDLDPASQAALDQLSVVPSGLRLPTARALLGELTVLAEAEQRGIVEVRGQTVAFRHELARCAVAESLPTSEVMRLNTRVLEILVAAPEPDLSSVVHHARQAGAPDVVVEFGPRAAQQAAAAGAHAQEINFYRQVLEYDQYLTGDQVASVHQSLALALFTVSRMTEALDHGLRGLGLREAGADPGAVGEALCALAPIYWALNHPAESNDCAERAALLLRADIDSPRLAFALLYQGLLLTANGAIDAAGPVAVEAHAMAQRLGLADLIAITRALLGRTRLLDGDVTAISDMTDGLDATIAAGNHIFAMMTYVLLVQDLWDLGRITEAERHLTAGIAYAHERELTFYVDILTVYQARLRAHRGDWEPAIACLREAIGDRGTEPAASVRYGLPTLARLLARCGADDASALVDWAREYATQAAGHYELIPSAFAEVELAWLTNQPGRAQEPLARLRTLTAGAGQLRARAELHRWLARLGDSAEAFPGCPEEFALGIRGDWQAAADAWRDLDAPYERALELLDSREVEPTLTALQIFTDLDAQPLITIARSRLRDFGASAVRKGPVPATRANPAGLTERQVDILRRLSSGCTNAEIAAELVVSVRTVDHHVSAVLQKLGINTRRQAASVAAGLGIT